MLFFIFMLLDVSKSFLALHLLLSGTTGVLALTVGEGQMYEGVGVLSVSLHRFTDSQGEKRAATC